MQNPMLSRLQPNNPIALIQQFNQFKQQMAGKDPEAIVNELLRTGKMSPEQFEQLKAQANTLMQFLS